MDSFALMNNYGHRALTLVKGEGCYVWDDKGHQYLDALAGIAVCGLGHCHPAVTAAITKQAGELLHVSNLYHLPPQQQAAQLLARVSGMEKVFFCNSGAEANEAAIKIARKYGNENNIVTPTIITMNNSFHGRTMATLSATGNPNVKVGFSPLVTGFIGVPYNDIDAVKQHLDNPDVVAVLVEPIQGEGGIHIPDANYLPALRTLCDQQGWLLMLDEIQTGNGRTGHYYAFQEYDFLPDVLTTAKGLGNGMPIGACLSRGQAATVLQPGNHGSTYGGNPVACAAVNAVFDTLAADQLCTRAQQLGEYFEQQLQTLLADKKSVIAIRQKGLMIGIELNYDCRGLVQAAADRSVLINVCGGNRVVRLLPALTMTDSQADQVIHVLISIIP